MGKCPGHPFLNFLEPPLQILKSYAKPDEVIHRARVLHSTSGQIWIKLRSNVINWRYVPFPLRVTVTVDTTVFLVPSGYVTTFHLRRKKKQNKNSHPIMSLLIPPNVHKFITYGGMQTTDKMLIIIIIIIPGDLPAFKFSINFSTAQCTNIMLLEIIKKIIKIIIIIAAQNYYKNWRHDKVARVVQWNLCKKFGCNATELGIWLL